MSAPRACDGCARPIPQGETPRVIADLAKAGIENTFCAACAAWLDPYSRSLLISVVRRVVARLTPALKDEPNVVERAR